VREKGRYQKETIISVRGIKDRRRNEGGAGGRGVEGKNSFLKKKKRGQVRCCGKGRRPAKESRCKGE